MDLSAQVVLALLSSFKQIEECLDQRAKGTVGVTSPLVCVLTGLVLGTQSCNYDRNLKC